MSQFAEALVTKTADEFYDQLKYKPCEMPKIIGAPTYLKLQYIIDHAKECASAINNSRDTYGMLFWMENTSLLPNGPNLWVPATTNQGISLYGQRIQHK